MQQAIAEYSFEKAKEVAAEVIGLYKSETLQQAVRSAHDELSIRQIPGRVQVFIPCNAERVTPDRFDALLRGEQGAGSFKIGEEMRGGGGIYGTGYEAFEARKAGGGIPQQFFVYDSGAGVIVDLINRKGKTLLNLMMRASYLDMLQSNLGFSVRWEERPLVE